MMWCSFADDVFPIFPIFPFTLVSETVNLKKKSMQPAGGRRRRRSRCWHWRRGGEKNGLPNLILEFLRTRISFRHIKHIYLKRISEEKSASSWASSVVYRSKRYKIQDFRRILVFPDTVFLYSNFSDSGWLAPVGRRPQHSLPSEQWTWAHTCMHGRRTVTV